MIPVNRYWKNGLKCLADADIKPAFAANIFTTDVVDDNTNNGGDKNLMTF